MVSKKAEDALKKARANTKKVATKVATGKARSALKGAMAALSKPATGLTYTPKSSTKKATTTAAAPSSKAGRLSDEFAKAKKATPPAVKKAVKKTATAAKKTAKRAVSAVKKVAKKRAVAGGGRAAEAGRTSWYTTK